MRSLIIRITLLALLGTAAACTDTHSGESGTPPDREIIHTDRAPEAVGPYSQAVKAGNTLWLAGQVGLIPGEGVLEEGLENQTRRAMQNIEAVLGAAGFGLADVVDVQVFLADMEDYDRFNEIYGGYFEADPPARAVVEVSRLPLDARVEIKMTAARQQ